MPSSGVFSFKTNSTISKFPREKVSTLTADGSFKTLKSSLATNCSGFMVIEISSSFFIKARLLSLYSGPRIRAIVCAVPIRFARKQLNMLNSSEPVTAIISSHLFAPASSSASESVPLPQRVITS